jgi:hypothetical protein
VAAMSISVGADDACVFTQKNTQPAAGGDVDMQIEVVWAQCAPGAGTRWLNLWVEDSCGNNRLVDSVPIYMPPKAGSCKVTSAPAAGLWQADFESDFDCICSAGNPLCHSLYVGQLVSQSGNNATLRYKKTGGGLPSEPVDYWVVVLSESQLSCELLPQYAVRKKGNWNPDDGELEVTVLVWPTPADCEAVAAGATKRLALITSGKGSPGKTWFTPTPITFTRSQ